ncbi:MAG TPA: rhomboid family intramembrane serine protease [Planctomycetes bacterium]|nr:rhomboid family intramembrane serine protease [Planctomycetota bacterium]
MIPIAGSVRSLRPPIVTITLIMVNVFVFLQETHLAPQALEALIHRYGLTPAAFTAALAETPGRIDLWLIPFFTSMFLHGGWGHLIGNMLFLYVFGDGVENRLGHGRFLLFYLLSGAGAASMQIAMASSSAVPMVGASGAIAGVLGAYLVLYPTARITVLVPILFLPLFFDIPAAFFLLFWFGQQLIAGSLGIVAHGVEGMGGVAWWAHVGGFTSGIFWLGLLLDRRHLGHRPARYDARAYHPHGY